MTDDGVRECKEVGNRAAIPVGGPGVPPLVVAGVGYGFAGNTHNFAPTGMMGGALQRRRARRRGDDSLPRLQGRGPQGRQPRGKTTADMANGPVQRIQPWPEALAMLEKLGAMTSHGGVSF